MVRQAIAACGRTRGDGDDDEAVVRVVMDVNSDAIPMLLMWLLVKQLMMMVPVTTSAGQ